MPLYMLVQKICQQAPIPDALECESVRTCVPIQTNKHELFNEPQVRWVSASHGRLALRKDTNYCVT